MNEQENPIIEQLKGMTQLKWGREQQEYYKQIVKDCRPVQCERMRDVLTAKQLEFIKGFYHAQQKQCYRNAAELVFLMERADWLFPEPVRYIEVTHIVCSQSNTRSLNTGIAILTPPLNGRAIWTCAKNCTHH